MSIENFDELPDEAEEILESIGNVIIDDDLSEGLEGFKITTISGEEIGRIYNGSFYAGDEQREHLGVEVSESWRRKGIATKMFQLWEILKGSLPEEEYTRDTNKIQFLKSIGYKVIQILDNIGNEHDKMTESTYARLIKE